jgi:hypothetical protein
MLTYIQFGHVKSKSCSKKLPVQTKCTVQYHVCTELFEHSSYRASENMFNALNVVVGAHLWKGSCEACVPGI